MDQKCISLSSSQLLCFDGMLKHGIRMSSSMATRETDWIVLEAVDHIYQPIPAGILSDTVWLLNLSNRIMPIIRYDLGDRI